MSAPFPSNPVPSIGYRPRLDQLMTPRGSHVPTWYDPSIHPEPEKIFVKQDGIPVLAWDGEPFTVAEMPIERRWCVRADGEVMPKHEFTAGIRKIIVDYYELKKQENPSVKFEGVIEREPVPSVVDYVTKMVNPEDERRLILMHYDQNATLGAVPQQLASTKSGKIEYKTRIDSLLESYANPSTRQMMKPREIEEVKAHFRGLEDQAISIGTAPSQPAVSPPKPKKRAPKTRMACGEEIYNLHRKRHVAKCEVCSKD